MAVALERAVEDQRAAGGEGCGGLIDQAPGGGGRDQMQQIGQHDQVEGAVVARPAGRGRVERQGGGDIGQSGLGCIGVDAGAAGGVDVAGLPSEARQAFGEAHDMLAGAAGDFQRTAPGRGMGGQQVAKRVEIARGGGGEEAVAACVFGDAGVGGQAAHACSSSRSVAGGGVGDRAEMAA